MSLTSTANVSDYLQTTIDGSSTPSSTVVDRWVDEVSDEIQHITKQTFQTVTVTDKILPINSDNTVASANSVDVTESWDLPAGRDLIILPHTNIISLDKFEINTVGDSETPVWEELTIGYGGDVVLRDDKIVVLSSNLVIKAQNASIRVGYTYGESSVPGFVQKIATRMVALEYVKSGLSSEVSSGGGNIRVGDIQITEPGRFSQSYVDTEQEWIDMKLRQIGTHNVYLI